MPLPLKAIGRFGNKLLRLSFEGIFQWAVVGLVVAAMAAVAFWLRGLSEFKIGFGAGFVCGVAFVVFAATTVALIRRALSAMTARREALSYAHRGYMDFLLQAEKATPEMFAILSKITEIQGSVTNTMDKHRIRIEAAAASSTAAKHKTIRRASKDLMRVTKTMTARVLDLERVAGLFNEGMSGWMKWLGMQRNEAAGLEREKMTALLNELVKNMAPTIEVYDAYLLSIESIKGISADLNMAAEEHSRTVAKLKDVIQQMMQSCSRVLQELKKASPNPPLRSSH